MDILYVNKWATPTAFTTFTLEENRFEVYILLYYTRFVKSNKNAKIWSCKIFASPTRNEHLKSIYEFLYL